MKRFWCDAIKDIEPYVPGEQPKDKKYIKLNTNESPYPPSPRAIEAIKSAADADLKLYPDPDAGELKEAIAAHYGVAKKNVFCGNGSDEVLMAAFLAFFRNKAPLVAPDITYSFYPVYCGLFGIGYATFPVKDDWSIDLARVPQQNGGVIFPNPNAPTAMALGLEPVEALLQRNTGTVVLADEAYVDFGAQTAVPLTKKYPNLLVVQTFSKSRALAGLRVGFAIGHEDLITGLESVKNSFNSYPLDRLAIAGAAAAMRDKEYFEQTRAAVIATRERTVAALKTLGFEVLPSLANFVFARHPHHSGAKLFEGLRQRGILVRYWNKPRLADHLRITIGTDDEMTALAAALTAIIQK